MNVSVSWSSDPEILNGVYMSEALNDVFISNFQKDPTLTWQFFGSSAGFFRLYPGTESPVFISLYLNLYNCILSLL